MSHYPHYPKVYPDNAGQLVAGDDVRAVIEQARVTAADLDGVFDEFAGQHETALASLEGGLKEAADREPRLTGKARDDLRAKLVVGFGATSMFADEIDGFNGGIDDLNVRYETAFRAFVEEWLGGGHADAVDAPNAPRTAYEAWTRSDERHALDSQYRGLWAYLDGRAAEIGRMFDGVGPGRADVQAMFASGAIPPEDAVVCLEAGLLTDADIQSWFFRELWDGNIDSLEDIPPGFDEVLLNNPVVVATLPDWMTVDGDVGEFDGNLIRHSDPTSPFWSGMRRRLEWHVAFGGLAQAVADDPDLHLRFSRSNLDYLENVCGEAVGDVSVYDETFGDHHLAELNDRLDDRGEPFRRLFADALIALGDYRTGGDPERHPESVRYAGADLPPRATASGDDLRELLESARLTNVYDMILEPYLP